jgi:hypothetical protein
VLVVALLGAVGLALLVAVTVVPFVLTLQRADRRGVSTGRAGALALGTSLLGPAAAPAARACDRGAGPGRAAAAAARRRRPGAGHRGAAAGWGGGDGTRPAPPESSAGVEHPEHLGEPALRQRSPSSR